LEATESEEVILTVDAYLRALARKDISAAPLHPDVTFESPLSPLIQGSDAVRQAFTGFFPASPCFYSFKTAAWGLSTTQRHQA
jgi:hypothetical protein